MSSTSSDAAEQVVRISMDGAEFALKVAGTGAVKLTALLYAVLKDQKRTKGRIRLTNMLKNGEELSVFAVRDQDMQKFCTEARKYGVLYTVLKDRDANDGYTDLMVRAKDAGKISRIIERFGLATVDMGSVKAQIEREQGVETDGPVQGMTPQEKVEAFLDSMLRPEPEGERQKNANPRQDRAEGEYPSGPSSGRNSHTGDRHTLSTAENRPSVRLQLKELQQKSRDSVPSRPERQTARKKRTTPKRTREQITKGDR